MGHEQAGTLLRQLGMLLGTPAAETRSDEQLLQEFIGRQNEAAFNTLLHRHKALVWNVCRRVLHRDADVEDAFQATFLVLARRARSIRKGEALGSWLYGVAYRVAVRARKKAAQRHWHERQAEVRPGPLVPLEVAWRELQALLDEELARLPEKYRAPFVLCCLEGKSRKDAALELGWKEGTVSGRVALAREALRQRLSRRGIRLSAVLCACAVSPGLSLATVPVALVRSTVRAGLLVAAGEGALAPGVSPTAAALPRRRSCGFGMPRRVLINRTASLVLPI